MLPSLGFQEIVLLGIIALVVVGPKDLPLLLRKLGMWTAKLRGMAQEFRTGFDELARQAELDELKREVEALRQTTNLSSLRNEMTKPLGTLESYAGVPPAPMTEPLTGPVTEPVTEPAAGPVAAPMTEPEAAPAEPPPPDQSASEDMRAEEPLRQSAP